MLRIKCSLCTKFGTDCIKHYLYHLRQRHCVRTNLKCGIIKDNKVCGRTVNTINGLSKHMQNCARRLSPNLPDCHQVII